MFVSFVPQGDGIYLGSVVLAILLFVLWLGTVRLMDQLNEIQVTEAQRRFARLRGAGDRAATLAASGRARVSQRLWWEYPESIDSIAAFRAIERNQSLRRGRDQWCVPVMITVLAPVVIVGLGCLMAVTDAVLLAHAGDLDTDIVGFVVTWILTDTITWIFAGLGVIFFNTVFLLDARLFETIGRIESAFDEPRETFYATFGEMARRLYEPLPTNSPGGAGFHPPWILLLVVVLVVGVGVQFLQGSPRGKPPFVQSYFIFLTFMGLFAIGVLLWVFSVVFVYSTRNVPTLSVNIPPTSEWGNLGFAPYGAFVTAITFRITLTLALGLVAIATIDSFPFIVGLAVFNLGTILVWFFGAQWGIHRAIVTSKREHLRTLEIERERDGSSSMNAANEIYTLRRNIKDLPEWPVNFSSVLTVVGSWIASVVPALLVRLSAAGIEPTVSSIAGVAVFDVSVRLPW